MKRNNLRLKEDSVKKILVALLFCSACATPVMASTIIYNFDDAPVPSDPPFSSIPYNNWYPGLSLASDTPGASVVIINATAFSASPPNIIGAKVGASGTIGNLMISVGSGNSITSFAWKGDESSIGTGVGYVDVFQSGSLFTTLNLLATGVNSATKTIDLSSYSNVDQIKIRGITDPGGLAFDDITVTTNAVPEPSTYALLCISLGVVGYARKKLNKQD